MFSYRSSTAIVALAVFARPDGLLKTRRGLFDAARSVEIIDDSARRFHFSHPYPGRFFDAGLPILPIHEYGKYRLRSAGRLNRAPSWPFRFLPKPMEIVLPRIHIDPSHRHAPEADFRSSPTTRRAFSSFARGISTSCRI
jgi:hypothetical protein